MTAPTTPTFIASPHTCASCKHWNGIVFDGCAHTDHECMRIRAVLDITIDQGSGWGAGGASIESIWTRSDFSCGAWEARRDPAVHVCPESEPCTFPPCVEQRRDDCTMCGGTGKKRVCTSCNQDMPCPGTDDVLDQTQCSRPRLS